jgi:hypothetical protein
MNIQHGLVPVQRFIISGVAGRPKTSGRCPVVLALRLLVVMGGYPLGDEYDNIPVQATSPGDTILHYRTLYALGSSSWTLETSVYDLILSGVAKSPILSRSVVLMVSQPGVHPGNEPWGKVSSMIFKSAAWHEKIIRGHATPVLLSH